MAEDEILEHENDIEDEENILITDLDENYIVDDSINHLVAHLKDVFCISLSNNKQWLACGSEDDTASLWKVSNKEIKDPYCKIQDHCDSVNCVAFNAANSLLATSDMSGRIICTELETKKQRCIIDDTKDVEWMIWHTTADILFSGTTEGLIWMWLITINGVSQSKIYSRGLIGSSLKGQLLSDGKHLLSIYSDGDVRLWNLQLSTSKFIKLSSPGYSLDIHPNLSLAAIGCANSSIALISLDSMQLLNVINAKDYNCKKFNNNEENEEVNAIEVVRFASEFQWLMFGTTNGDLKVYDLQYGNERFSSSHNGNAVVDCKWRFNSTTSTLEIISICMDGGVRIWNGKTGEPIEAKFCGDEGVFDFCVLEPDNETDSLKVFVACSNGIVRLFEF